MKSKAAKMASVGCMPRLTRGSCRASTAQPAASVSLLERIRDVVLRLIMLTAVSKASVQRSSSSRASSSPRADARAAAVAVTCRRDDSIRNEAVEECIEFLKRSSAEGDAVKLSSVTAETVADAVAAVNGTAPTRVSSVAAVTENAAVAAGVADIASQSSAAI
uniref:Uncharacterized protein n=1 Tax=Avena sativa TaxID=4498 RepID=A0ACD5TQ30_AVESA